MNYKKTVKYFFSLFAMSFMTVASLIAGVSFGSLDINSSDDLLYTVTHDFTGEKSYTSLFTVHLDEQHSTDSTRLLTCYPEHMELLDGGRQLEIRNRYGTAVYWTQRGVLEWKKVDVSVPKGYLNLTPYAESPDGKWICYLEQTTSVSGKLVLQEVKTGRTVVLNNNAHYLLDSVNVKWSYDSTYVLYEMDENIYFVNPETVFRDVELPSGYCKIGRGSINSVQWTRNGSLIYVDRDIIYQIQEKELYTRGLYASLLGSGRIIGRLPSAFDSYTDQFWVDDSFDKMIVIEKSKHIFSYQIKKHSYNYVEVKSFYSITDLRGSLLDCEVFWYNGNNPLLWVDYISHDTGKKIARIYDLKNGLKPLFEVKNPLRPKLSPSARYLAFAGENNLYVYDMSNLKQVSKLAGEGFTSFVWNNDSALYAGTSENVRYWNLQTASSGGSTKLVTLSSVSSAFWSIDKVSGKTYKSNSIYMYNEDTNTWYETQQKNIKNLTSKNSNYRVFLDLSRNSLFSNAIFIRSITDTTLTYPLHKETQIASTPYKKVSVAFDALDNADALAFIMDTLNKFGINATFFINGEFIRRYPEETRQIAQSSNVCASMFYSSADLLSDTFMIDKDFIIKGLARNEDEFFDVTGHELSLYWHAPHYRADDVIKNAGKEAGYSYVDAPIKINWKTESKLTLKSSSTDYEVDALIVDCLSNLNDGDVISISLGETGEAEEKHLYQKIDLFLSAILDFGYDIVNIAEL